MGDCRIALSTSIKMGSGCSRLGSVERSLGSLESLGSVESFRLDVPDAEVDMEIEPPALEVLRALRGRDGFSPSPPLKELVLLRLRWFL